MKQTASNLNRNGTCLPFYEVTWLVGCQGLATPTTGNLASADVLLSHWTRNATLRTGPLINKRQSGFSQNHSDSYNFKAVATREIGDEAGLPRGVRNFTNTNIKVLQTPNGVAGTEKLAKCKPPREAESAQSKSFFRMPTNRQWRQIPTKRSIVNTRRV